MTVAPMSIAVVIPVRSFVLGKERLGIALPDAARAALAADMARGVITAAGDRPVLIVSSAPEVVASARSLGLDCIGDPGTLDEAATAGLHWARTNGHARVVIAHADLPLVTSFDAVAGLGREAILVPDHRNDGNPVLSLPSDVDFVFAYGPGSAARHEAEARRHGLDVEVVRDPALAFDVDTPADLAELSTRRTRSA
jgi:2-phospho-L-lactate/phosphoenolpyruvate guanylyltransferase